ncbi:Arylsulfatase A [Spirosomataceae bacterium TFI 002]|nr:Arylsulfatase A [Spirosomataceae bacterium TFI 002]
MQFKSIFVLIFGFIIFVACKSTIEEDNLSPNLSDRPNVLLIIGDDMGKDAMNGFSEGVLKPQTPNLDKLMADGLTFTNFWTNPTCSPTRAAILTGKYGYRTGVKDAGDILSNTETIIHKYINQETDNAYATALIGKWHLSGNQNVTSPEDLGMDYFSGIMKGTVGDYYNWLLAENGSESISTEYVSTKLTDLAINWVGEQEKPWFLCLSYTAPHTPFHIPPSGTFSQEIPFGRNNLETYIAAIESMDYDIGRLLAKIPAEQLKNTTVVFLGDNGTPNQVAQFPYTASTVKGTIYQGGINMPLIISGYGVERRGKDENLIAATDLFSTIATIAGSSVENIHDSKSFKKLLTINGGHRDYVYSEQPNGYTIRNSQFKLIVYANSEELYDLSVDPYEKVNLMLKPLANASEIARNSLLSELKSIRN